MKKLILLLCIIIIVLGACNISYYEYEDGTFIGEGQGHHSTIKVKVIVEDNQIKQIDILDEHEIPGLKEIVYEKMPIQIMKKNTWQVDGVSGATLTSNGYRDAVEDALKDVVISEDE